MDIETLASFISNCKKQDFEIACKVVLHEIFNLIVINVDGPLDGGSDYVNIEADGTRDKVAYQITTQKSDIKNKAYKDAKKSIEKIHAKKYYFLCSYNLNEIECRSIENTISTELNIPAVVFSPRIIAGLMVTHKKVGEFLDRIGYPDLYQYERNRVDYREMALHSYSFLSKDTKNLKSMIYDDAILMSLADSENGLDKSSIVEKVIELLGLPKIKETHLLNRIDFLKGKGDIENHSSIDNLLVASDKVQKDIRERKVLYEKELSDLAASQTDIMNEYGIDWTMADSQRVAVWLANTYMKGQLTTLESANATLADSFFKNIDKNGYSNLKAFLKTDKNVGDEIVDDVIKELVNNASTHPLMTKITSASVYIALEGGNPLTSCRSLGVSSWHDEKLLVEPTIGIPFLCSVLYKGRVNRFFDSAIKSLDRANELGIPLFVPYYYIKECAGHLHMARKFDGLNLNPNEMQYSCNAFVSNYYALKESGIKVHDKFMDYLATFSPAIRTEMNYKEWIRAIMNDIQSLFTRNGIVFQDIPNYSSDDLKQEQTEYCFYLKEKSIEKSDSLMKNDAITLHFTNERSRKDNDHWMILTYDRSMINVANNIRSNTWVNTPFTFLELTEMTKELSEREFASLVQSMVTFRSKTFEVGARILDRIILFASDKMQDWEFMESIQEFKSEMVEMIPQDDTKFLNEVDKRTNEFLSKHGVKIDIEAEKNDVDLGSE